MLSRLSVIIIHPGRQKPQSRAVYGADLRLHEMGRDRNDDIYRSSFSIFDTVSLAGECCPPHVRWEIMSLYAATDPSASANHDQQVAAHRETYQRHGFVSNFDKNVTRNLFTQSLSI